MSDHSERFYPLLFEPVLKRYIWGGRNLGRLTGRKLPDERIAESWEIAAHEDGSSLIINGRYAGLSLKTVHQLLGLDLIGRRNGWAQERGKFPLLVKLLDAQEKLSVQVHPDDDYAAAHEGNELGKTEMWVILHAEPGAEIIMGLRQGTTPEAFHQAIIDGTLEKYLHRIPVSAGDFVCVPSGTIHAILNGIVIAEIQQNSNTTYRVFDWNRVENGTGRPLHIDKALEVVDFEKVEPGLGNPVLMENTAGICRSLLCQNQYFSTEIVEIEAGREFTAELNGDTLEIWGVIQGQIQVNDLPLRAVNFTLLPAALGRYRLRSDTGAVCLRTYMPETH